MKLPVQKKEERDEVYYFGRFAEGDYAKTVSMNQAVCQTSKEGDIGLFTLSDSSFEEFSEFRRLVSNFEPIEVTEHEVTIWLTAAKAKRQALCMVNIDWTCLA